MLAQVAVLCVFDLSPLPRPLIGLPFSLGQSVSEVKDHGSWLEERLAVCERLLIMWRWISSTHTGSGLCGCGGGMVECHCVMFGVVQVGLYIVCGLPVGFQWSVKIS